MLNLKPLSAADYKSVTTYEVQGRFYYRIYLGPKILLAAKRLSPANSIPPCIQQINNLKLISNILRRQEKYWLLWQQDTLLILQSTAATIKQTWTTGAQQRLIIPNKCKLLRIFYAQVTYDDRHCLISHLFRLTLLLIWQGTIQTLPLLLLWCIQY
jgi:hypothetical protein